MFGSNQTVKWIVRKEKNNKHERENWSSGIDYEMLSHTIKLLLINSLFSHFKEMSSSLDEMRNLIKSNSNKCYLFRHTLELLI